MALFRSNTDDPLHDTRTRDQRRPPHPAQRRRIPPFWRWLGIGGRAVHLAAVVLLGATILGAAPRVPLVVTGAVLLVSGVGLLALEIWRTVDNIREYAGAATLAKLALVAWMLVDPAHAEWTFWAIVLWSVVFAHAPATFRHRRIGFRRE